jgi:hypothetical protein
MTSLSDVSDWIAERLPALIEQYDVPAAAVAVLADGEVIDDAVGVLSMATEVETTDSVFQIDRRQALTSSLSFGRSTEGRPQRGDPDVPAGVRIADGRREPDHRRPDPSLRGRHLHRHRTRRRLRRGSTSASCTTSRGCSPGAMWSTTLAGFSVLGRIIGSCEKPYDACHEHLIKPQHHARRNEPLRGDPVPRRHRPHPAEQDAAYSGQALPGRARTSRPARCSR